MAGSLRYFQERIMFNKNKSTSMTDNYINIISSVVETAAGQTEGVASITNESGSVLNNVGRGIKKSNRSIKVDIINDNVTIELSINAYSTYTVPELVCRLQENIKKEVEKATCYRVKAINVYVVGVVFTS